MTIEPLYKTPFDALGLATNPPGRSPGDPICVRLSASDLDAYAYYTENEAAPTEELIARLERRGTVGPQAEIGKAIHAALEHAKDGDVLVRIDTPHGPVSFDSYDGDIELPAYPIRELRHARRLGPPFLAGDAWYQVELVGVVDASDGDGLIVDWKTTGNADAERFWAGWQWRAYLWLFDARVFVWHILVLGSDRKTGGWRVVSHLPLRQYRYPNLLHDLQDQAGRLARFCIHNARARLFAAFESDHQ
jgi:hypothetical protein